MVGTLLPSLKGLGQKQVKSPKKLRYLIVGLSTARKVGSSMQATGTW